jgi:hypothetical protein
VPPSERRRRPSDQENLSRSRTLAALGRYRLTVPSRLSRAAALAAATATALSCGAALVAATTPSATAITGPATGTTTSTTATRQITYKRWTSPTDFAAGTLSGVRVAQGKLRVSTPVGRTAYVDSAGVTRSYDYGRWTSPWTSPGFSLTELVPSWTATTPRDTWVQVEARGATATGSRSSWDVLGRWAQGDRKFHRTSLGAQRDDLARVATDTWETQGAGLVSWQLRVTLNRRTGTTATPWVDTVGAMTSALPAASAVPTSRPGVGRGIVLPVPRYSQMIHSGQYPRFGGGGEAWCSPTSTSMVLGYYQDLPPAADYAWVDPSYRNPYVDQVARATYDYGYEGTGNWPFNTAYAANRTGHAFVTRLRSLAEAELFIRAGIPVIASISFARGGLTGAPISATAGHLVVIVGFTSTGDVVVNDPAAQHNAGVRRTYDRAQFEDAWVKRYTVNGATTGSGGLAYVIRDAAHPLPPRKGRTNW